MTLDELERLEKAATPGPWWHNAAGKVTSSQDVFVRLLDEASPTRKRTIGHCKDEDVSTPTPRDWSNAEFIAVARNALPDLLKIARAVASKELRRGDEGFGSFCPMCDGWADDDHSDEPDHTDTAAWSRWQTTMIARTEASVPHASDCALSLAQKLAGGGA